MPWFRKLVNSFSIRNWLVKFYFGLVDLPDWDTPQRVLSGLWDTIALADDKPKSKSSKRIFLDLIESPGSWSAVTKDCFRKMAHWGQKKGILCIIFLRISEFCAFEQILASCFQNFRTFLFLANGVQRGSGRDKKVPCVLTKFDLEGSGELLSSCRTKMIRAILFLFYIIPWQAEYDLS